MSDLDELARAVQERHDPPALRQLASALPDPIPYAARIPIARSTIKRGNILGRYRRRCGLRSLILQGILAGWTFMIGSLMVFILAGSTHAMGSDMYPAIRGTSMDFETHNPIAERNRLESSIESCMCIGAGWLVIGLPLGIAAVVTIRPE